MATPEQIQQAMRLAITAEDASAVAELRQMLTEAYQAEVPKATEGMGTGQRLLAGIGQGMSNVGRQAGNLVGMRSDEELQDAAALDRDLLSTGAGKTGAFIGEVAATAPVGGLAGAAAKQAATRAGLTGAQRLLATGAGMGGVQGAAEGGLTAGPNDRLRGAALGGAGGAILPGVAGAAGRALARGADPTAAAKSLMRQGVDLTPGQMRPGSGLAQVEEAAQSIPFAGGAIRGLREGAEDQWRGLVRKEAAAPGATQTGSLEELYAGYRPAYDQAKGFPTYPRQMNTQGPDVPLADFPQTPGAFTRAAEAPGTRAGREKRDAVSSWLQDRLTTLPGAGKGAGTFDSEKLLRLRSDIRDEIRKASQGANPDTESADLLRNAEQWVTRSLESQLPPDALKALRAADMQYGKYKTVEDAYGRAGDQLSGMMPAKLSAAVKSATPAAAYARGEGGPLRRLAQEGRQSFEQRSPPTGARVLTMGAPAAALGAVFGVPAAVGGAVLPAALIGTRTGRKLAGGQTAIQKKAQQTAAALRRKAGRRGREVGRTYTRAAGAQAANELYEE